jgi:DNA replication protein DnaC
MDLTGFVKALEAQAAASIKAAEGDYEKDGLLHCGKCNTPKQYRLMILGSERTVPVLCKCEAERKEAEDAARKKAKFDEFVNRIRKEAFPAEKMLSWTFENDDRTNARISDAMKRYADNYNTIKEADINGLVLFGTVGTGKSFYAACIANALVDRGIPVLMTSFDRIRNKVQESFEGRQEYIDSIAEYPLLIIDDLGAESGSEFMQEIVFNVIDARARSGKPLIVTTNLTAQALKNPSDERKQRIHSRLLGMCQPIEVSGTDRRCDRLKKESKSMKDILGL